MKEARPTPECGLRGFVCMKLSKTPKNLEGQKAGRWCLRMRVDRGLDYGDTGNFGGDGYVHHLARVRGFTCVHVCQTHEMVTFNTDSLLSIREPHKIELKFC